MERNPLTDPDRADSRSRWLRDLVRESGRYAGCEDTRVKQAKSIVGLCCVAFLLVAAAGTGCQQSSVKTTPEEMKVFKGENLTPQQRAHMMQMAAGAMQHRAMPGASHTGTGR